MRDIQWMNKQVLERTGYNIRRLTQLHHRSDTLS
jgi:hypothetical protein